MKSAPILAAMLLACALPALADDAKPDDKAAPAADNTKPKESVTTGSVSIGGNKISYHASAGTLILKNDKDEPAASVFYVYYSKDGTAPANRPVTFFYNGGPGSSTIWLHMGSFAPLRVKTDDHTHTPAAPYQLVNNDNSLLDVTDEVFIDAPGTGFSRVLDKDLGGKGDPKDFYGVDQDAKAFTAFIEQFLSKYGRWNSPKYLFGESYGTIRSPVVALDLQGDSVDLNGVILLSAAPNFSMIPDLQNFNPGFETPFATSLPSMAAVAWYQDKIPNKPAKLEGFLKDVEHFAMTDYLTALNAGNKLDSATKRQIAEKLQGYTSVPADYWYKANLRVAGGQFEHELLRDSGELTGRNDGRFAAYALDPLGEFAEYDPQSLAIGSTYASLLNEYVRGTLKFGTADEPYLPRNGSVNQAWDFKHVFPGAGFSPPTGLNVLPDLATAMIQNPDMKVMLNSGYYDLTTAYYAAEFQLQHLAIPDKLEANITYARYPSGHMVYANEASARALHDNVAKFINDSHK